MAEAGRVAHARGQCGTADVGQAGQGPGQPGGVDRAVVVLAVGGVGGEFGGDGAQQPDLGGDLGGQAGEIGGGVPVVEFQRCPGGIEPLAGAFGVLVVAGGLGDQSSQPGQASPGQGSGVGVAFQDGQVGGAEVAAKRAHRQQLAGQVPDPGLVLGGLAGEPVGGADPAVQRRPAGAGQLQRLQPGPIEQWQPGQGIGVDTVGLGVPGQEPAQVGCFL